MQIRNKVVAIAMILNICMILHHIDYETQCLVSSVHTRRASGLYMRGSEIVEAWAILFSQINGKKWRNVKFRRQVSVRGRPTRSFSGQSGIRQSIANGLRKPNDIVADHTRSIKHIQWCTSLFFWKKETKTINVTTVWKNKKRGHKLTGCCPNPVSNRTLYSLKFDIFKLAIGKITIIGWTLARCRTIWSKINAPFI